MRGCRMGWSGPALACWALLLAGGACAVVPPPGAWIHQEAELQVGVVVDWALWEGETYEAREGMRALEGLLETGRVRNVYLYALSDGHTVCPFAGVPLPSLGVAESTAELAQFLQRLHAANVKVHAVLDLLEWHRPGSRLPDPLAGELTELKELTLGPTAEVAGSYASITHPRTREALAALIGSLRPPALPFDGVIVDAHYTEDELLGGCGATLAAYQRETGDDPSTLPTGPPATEEEEARIRGFRAWRNQHLDARLDELLRGIGEGVAETGLLGPANYWDLPGGIRANYANRWPLWMGRLPHSVLLLTGDYTDEQAVRTFYSSREGVLKRGCAAVPRPVIEGDAPLADITALCLAECGPIDEIVVRLKPGLNSKRLSEWAAALPKTCPLPETMPALAYGQFAGAPPVSVSFTDQPPAAAVEQVAAALSAAGLPPLSVGESYQAELAASPRTLSVDLHDAPHHVALTWLARELHGYYDLSAEAIVLQRLPDPQRVMADRLQQLGRFEEAETQYREVIERGWDIAHAYRGLGDTLRKTWRPSDALNAYDQAYQLGVRDPEFLMEAGNCFRDAGKEDYAQEFLTQALENCPPENIFVLSWVNVGIGRIYERKNQPEEAVIWLGRAVEVWPGNSWAYYWLAKVQGDLDLVDEAIQTLQRGLELDGSMTPAKQLLGQLEGRRNGR